MMKSILTATIALGLALPAFAAEEGKIVEEYAQDVQASSTHTAGLRLGCYVDTPRWDVPRADFCGGVAGPDGTATVVFRLMDSNGNGLQSLPAGVDVDWDLPCDWETDLYCVMNNQPTGTFSQVATVFNAATGSIEGEAGATVRIFFSPVFEF